jgi:beta-galactosidase
VPGSRWHPEQYQALFHEAYARQLAARPYLWGSFVWLGFDHASAGRNEGDAPGLNDKGLVSYDRKLRKDAYFLYQAYWSTQPVVHITSARFSPRPAGEVTVKAYSNASRLTLEVNGQGLGSAEVVDHVARWPGVVLQPGPQVLVVRADSGAADRVEWEVRP